MDTKPAKSLLIPMCDNMVTTDVVSTDFRLLWPPYVTGGPLYFCRDFYLLSVYLSFFYSSPNLSGHRLDVYHTLTHGVSLVRI